VRCYTGTVRVPESTLEPVDSRRHDVAGIWARRVFISLLAGVVVAGLFGFLGVRTDTAATEEAGYELSLHHATTARAGFDVPWEVTVTSAGGFDQTLELAVTGDYFDIYETQGFAPEPSESTRDGDTLYLTFEAPPGDTFVLAYDAYIQPSSQIGKDGTISVVVDDERVASVDFRTRLLP
jgi:hypothetical protein